MLIMKFKFLTSLKRHTVLLVVVVKVVIVLKVVVVAVLLVVVKIVVNIYFLTLKKVKILILASVFFTFCFMPSKTATLKSSIIQ